MSRRKYLICFLVMLVIMIVFLSYVLKHPEASVRVPVAMLQVFYIVYVLVMILCLVRYLKR